MNIFISIFCSNWFFFFILIACYIYIIINYQKYKKIFYISNLRTSHIRRSYGHIFIIILFIIWLVLVNLTCHFTFSKLMLCHLAWVSIAIIYFSFFGKIISFITCLVGKSESACTLKHGLMHSVAARDLSSRRFVSHVIGSHALYHRQVRHDSSTGELIAAVRLFQANDSVVVRWERQKVVMRRTTLDASSWIRDVGSESARTIIGHVWTSL